MDTELENRLIKLASLYETKDFLINDPSQFMHNYTDTVNQELAAFIAANLAFGRRDQILVHVSYILDLCGPDISQWIIEQKYRDVFVCGKKSFYRMFTHDSMVLFFDTIRNMLLQDGSIGSYVRKSWESCKDTTDIVYGYTGKPLLCHVISDMFDKECNLIPHTKESSSKKLNMFLRWMVRSNSPVDLGLWTWYDKRDLLMPLDTHVMQESTKFGLIESSSTGKVKSASLKTAVALTDILRDVFPEDPVKGDFALFGLGVAKQ